jgi:hypothetical protein
MSSPQRTEELFTWRIPAAKHFQTARFPQDPLVRLLLVRIFIRIIYVSFAQCMAGASGTTLPAAQLSSVRVS